MKFHLHSILALQILSLFCIAAAGQKGTITGIFASAKENDIVHFSSNNFIDDSVRVKNDQFTIHILPTEEWDVYYIKCPTVSPYYVFPVFVKGSSQLNLIINKTLDTVTISGDANAKEQNEFYQGLARANSDYFIFQKEILKTKDSLKLAVLNEKLKTAEEKGRIYTVQWVKTHKDSPFSVAVIRFCLAIPSLSKNAVALSCFTALSSKAKDKNNMVRILTDTLPPPVRPPDPILP